MAPAPISPTLTVFLDKRRQVPMSAATLTLKAAPAPAGITPQEYKSLIKQSNGKAYASTGQHFTLKPSDKSEPIHKQKLLSSPPAPDHSHHHKATEPSVNKQPYDGLLMPGETGDQDDGYRGMFVRWEMRPLVGRHVAKHWKDMPVFYDTDEDGDEEMSD